MSEADTIPTIPRIIHQTWIGPELPERFRVLTWITHLIETRLGFKLRASAPAGK